MMGLNNDGIFNYLINDGAAAAAAPAAAPAPVNQSNDDGAAASQWTMAAPTAYVWRASD